MRAAFPAARGDLTAACDGAGTCVVRRGAAVLATLRDVAPPMVFDDLDEDGAPELITASASAPDAADRARVFTVSADGVTERAGVAAPGPILAVAAGAGADGRVLVLAVRDLARGAATLLLAP
jgi:hypothetical protein